jgi:hypothetical protein
MQELPHSRRRNDEAELRQFAVDPAATPQRISLASRTAKRAMLGD